MEAADASIRRRGLWRHLVDADVTLLVRSCALRRALLSVPLIALLAACSEPAVPPPAVRAVRTEVVALRPVHPAVTYAGEVRPRFESTLGFRVAGKIAERRVNVGDSVVRGQALLVLDEQDLALAGAASRATAEAQAAQLKVEKADLERFGQLVAKGFLSKAEYDRQRMRFEASEAQLKALRAAARVSGNQAAYAVLAADADGTITTLHAEIGQVVAAGAGLVRLAHAGALEVSTQIPEGTVDRVRVGQPVDVRLWTDAETEVVGQVREIASSADPATRTFAVRVAVPDPPAGMRLGMTASVRLNDAAPGERILVPLTALVAQGADAGVWVVEHSASVAFRAIRVAGMEGNALIVENGLAPGDRIVTAGAPLLRAGQAVRLMEGAGQTP